MALLAAYGFNEGQGLTAADESGNNYTLTSNASVWYGGAKNGFGIYATGDNAFGRTGFGSGTTTTWTMMFWFQKQGTVGDWGNFIHDGSALWVQIDAAGRISQGDFQASTFINDSTWHHLAITNDGTTQRLYLDGVLNNSAARSYTVDWGRAWTIGNGIDGPPQCVMDEVRLFTHTLSQSEVATWMNTAITSGAPSGNNILYYETAWNTSGIETGDGETRYKDILVPGCEIGDLLLVFGISENRVTNAGSRYISDVSSGGVKTSAITLETSTTPAQDSDTDFYAGYTKAVASGNITLRVGLRFTAGNVNMVVGAFRISAALATGTHGFAGGMTASATGVAPITLTEESTIFQMLGDWTATTMGTSTVPSGGESIRSATQSGRYSYRVTRWNNQAAGTRNYGPSGLTGHDITGISFVLNTAASPSTARFYSSTGAPLTPYRLTGSGLIQLQ